MRTPSLVSIRPVQTYWKACVSFQMHGVEFLGQKPSIRVPTTKIACLNCSNLLPLVDPFPLVACRFFFPNTTCDQNIQKSCADTFFFSSERNNSRPHTTKMTLLTLLLQVATLFFRAHVQAFSGLTLILFGWAERNNKDRITETVTCLSFCPLVWMSVNNPHFSSVLFLSFLSFSALSACERTLSVPKFNFLVFWREKNTFGNLTLFFGLQTLAESAGLWWFSLHPGTTASVQPQLHVCECMFAEIALRIRREKPWVCRATSCKNSVKSSLSPEDFSPSSFFAEEELTRIQASPKQTLLSLSDAPQNVCLVLYLRFFWFYESLLPSFKLECMRLHSKCQHAGVKSSSIPHLQDICCFVVSNASRIFLP